MKNSKQNKRTDLEECKDKINAVLREYNCVIETDDYHWAWLRDNDINETVGIERS